MNYEKVIHAIVDDIVEDPSSLFIRIEEPADSKDVDIIIASEKADTARLIGHKGIIANSIREIVGIAGKSENKHVHIKFESFDEKTED